MWEPDFDGVKWFTMWTRDGTPWITHFDSEGQCRRFCAVVQRAVATGRPVYEEGVKRALINGRDIDAIIDLTEKLVPEEADSPLIVEGIG